MGLVMLGGVVGDMAARYTAHPGAELAAKKGAAARDAAAAVLVRGGRTNVMAWREACRVWTAGVAAGATLGRDPDGGADLGGAAGAPISPRPPAGEPSDSTESLGSPADRRGNSGRAGPEE